MKRFVPIVVAGTILAALIGSRGPFGGFWAPAPGAPHVNGSLLIGFLTENMVENLAFGIGLAIALFGRPWFVARTSDTTRATVGWLATVWLFASWMPHAALHLHVGIDPARLLPIEWIFHAGAIAAIAALMWSMWRRPVQMTH